MTAIALTIAGSDSGGGAGIQADLKTFSALGVYGTSVITAVTAQNTRVVRAIHEVPSALITEQIASVFDDIRINVVKIGMLGSVDIVRAVADALQPWRSLPIVLDPVMVAKSGDPLLAAAAVDALRDQLLPMAGVVTPNLAEAGALLGRPAPANESEMRLACADLLSLGPAAVLIKGGHLEGSSCIDIFADGDDIFADGDDMTALSAARTPTRNTHGTGCTLAAAIAAYLARGATLGDAVRSAKEFVGAAIDAADGLEIGHGHGPVHHFHAMWRRLESDHRAVGSS